MERSYKVEQKYKTSLAAVAFIDVLGSSEAKKTM